MFRIELHKYIAPITSIFYRAGFWHREDEPTVGEIRLKYFYSFYYFVFIISLIAGALRTADIDKLIFSIEFILIAIVVLVKLFYIIWRKNKTLQLLNRICCYSVDDDDTFAQVNDKLNFLMKFGAVYFSLMYLTAFCMGAVIPFVGSERKLFFNIAFPLDWENDEFAYWIAFTFMFTQTIISTVGVSFSAIIWYLMTNCGLRYEVLGQQFKTIGKVKSVEGITDGRKISDVEREKLYLRALLECISSHIYLKK